MKKILLGLVCAVAAGVAGTASATDWDSDITVTRSSGTAPQLGTVIRGSSASTYSISVSGLVARILGNAIRLSNASVAAPTITLDCGWTYDCAYRSIRVTIVPAGGSGSATIVKLRRGSVSGYGTSVGSVSEGRTLTFDLPPVGPLRQVSFPIGMDVQLAAGAGAGVHTFSYTVTAEYR